MCADTPFGMDAARMPGSSLIFLFPQFICTLFGLREAGCRHGGRSPQALLGAGTVFRRHIHSLAGYFQSCNQGAESLIISSLRGAIVLIPGVLFFFIPENGPCSGGCPGC